MKFKTLFFALCLTVTLASCSDDQDNNEIKNDTENSGNGNADELTEEGKKFVGLWGVSLGTNGHTFLFLPNGKACRDNKTFGLWSYDETSKVLATTIDMWQFQITAVFENNWVGYTINTGRGANASRGSDGDFLEYYLNMLSWNSTDSLMQYRDPFDANTNYYSISTISYSDVVIDGSTITANFSYSYSWDHWPHVGSGEAEGSVTITNAYADNPSMKIDSKLYRDSEIPMRKGTYIGYWR